LVSAPDRPRGRGRRETGSELVAAARAAGGETHPPEDPHAAAVVERLRALEPEVLCVASYGVILEPVLLELAPRGALNVHASLLPRWRGASPIQAAIRAGDRVTGVTIQRIVRELDAGDVLLAREHEIGPRETAGSLLAALAGLGGEALVEALDALEQGRATFTPQDRSRATYARKLTKGQGALDWTLGARELERLVRALQPWPGARCRDPRGRELVLLDSLVADGSGEPGTVLECAGRLVVACGEGALELAALVPAGKRPMSGAEFARGARLAPGERMGASGAG
jgi:methionyl-tRNA formyltransferase